MRNLQFIIPFILAGHIGFGQQIRPLQVSILKASTDSGYAVYEVAINNKSDSVVCVLHSMFISLGDNSQPHGLGLYRKTKSEEYYSLHYSEQDTLYNFESLPYRAECVLPYRSLSFKIRVPYGGSKMKQQFDFEYLYMADFCYKEFVKSMQKMTTWYLKYSRIEKAVQLPD